MKFLEGKKTYLIAVLVGFATIAHNLQWIDDTVYQWLLGLMGAGGLATLRAAVSKK